MISWLAAFLPLRKKLIYFTHCLILNFYFVHIVVNTMVVNTMESTLKELRGFPGWITELLSQSHSSSLRSPSFCALGTTSSPFLSLSPCVSGSVLCFPVLLILTWGWVQGGDIAYVGSTSGLLMCASDRGAYTEASRSQRVCARVHTGMCVCVCGCADSM